MYQFVKIKVENQIIQEVNEKNIEGSNWKLIFGKNQAINHT